MTFPIYRKSLSGLTLYKVLSAVKMISVHNMASVVMRMEITSNHLTITDALQDEFSAPSSLQEWDKCYNQILKHLITEGM